jgi:hypothetical protein
VSAKRLCRNPQKRPPPAPENLQGRNRSPADAPEKACQPTRDRRYSCPMNPKNRSQSNRWSRTAFALQIATLLALAGCATPNGPKVEKGPHGTIAYEIAVETDQPGVRIEVNGDYIGKTPCTIKLWGDKDGTFHNFGSQEYIIRALPNSTNQYVQTKVFRTGGWFSQEDMIPKRVYFDMKQKTSGFSVDLPPKY